MTIEPELLLFVLIVFGSYAVQTVTGFGSMLICVTLGAHLFEIREVITLAAPISILQTSYIVMRHHRGIDRPLLLRRVLPLMGAGTVLGFVGVSSLAGDGLRIAFGFLVLGLALRELWLARAGGQERPPPPRAVSIAAIAGAGLMHGVYATGGPLLVYAIGREGLDKHRFRSTLAAVWLVLGMVLIAGFAIEGRYDMSRALDVAVLLPAVPAGIAVGEWLHHRVDERRFKLGVWGLLVGAAIVLLLR